MTDNAPNPVKCRFLDYDGQTIEECHLDILPIQCVDERRGAVFQRKSVEPDADGVHVFCRVGMLRVDLTWPKDLPFKVPEEQARKLNPPKFEDNS